MRVYIFQAYRPVKDHHSGTYIMPPRSSNPSRQAPRRSTSQPAETTRGRAARTLITFVDSQDPHSRSAIQRHTAFHSNQQRRDARLQSLRTTSRPRLLEWQRRSEPEVRSADTSRTSRSNSSSSRSMLTAHERGRGSRRPSPDVPNSNDRAPIAFETDPQPVPISAAERDTLIQYLIDSRCLYNDQRQMYEDIISFSLEDRTCTYFLMAYALALRAHHQTGADTTADCDRARELLARGTTSLRNRLGLASNRASNHSMQAVLLLIAYTADFRNLEDVSIHARALGTMVQQRGGIDDGIFPDVLFTQLTSIHTSRFYHLTLGCTTTCVSLRRFPEGLYEQ